MLLRRGGLMAGGIMARAWQWRREYRGAVHFAIRGKHNMLGKTNIAPGREW